MSLGAVWIRKTVIPIKKNNIFGRMVFLKVLEKHCSNLRCLKTYFRKLCD